MKQDHIDKIKFGHDDDKPVVQLTGINSNAFSIMGACKKAARKAGWEKEKIDKVIEEMMSGDYDHLLATAQKYFEAE